MLYDENYILCLFQHKIQILRGENVNDEYLLERGYKPYKPNPVLDNESIVAKFQKRFDDDFGKKYFIDIAKWSNDYIPKYRRDELWEQFSYEYHLCVSMFDEEKPIWLNFGTSWTVEEVESFASDLFNKIKPNYYESWDGDRGVRPQ